jgi:hypothetical protein
VAGQDVGPAGSLRVDDAHMTESRWRAAQCALVLLPLVWAGGTIPAWASECLAGFAVRWDSPWPPGVPAARAP